MIRHGRVFVAGGFRPAIIKEGPKWSQVVYIDGTSIRVRKVKGKLELSPITGLTRKGIAYRMLRPKNVLGVKQKATRTAKRILREAVES